MPIYEYRCDHCGHQLEAIRKISDAPLSDCPKCGQAALKKMVSAPTFRLSGSGWYETDFKSDKEKRRNLAQSESTASADKPVEKTAAKAAGSQSKTGTASSNTAAKAD